jgi:hypothetical protein
MGKCHSESSRHFILFRRLCANFWTFGRVGIHLVDPSRSLLEVLRFFSNCAHYRMRKFSLPALVLVLISMTTASFGANFYVRKGATGTNKGTDWTNAWNEMNQINFSSVACGDIIWIAGGTYTTSISAAKSCTSSSVLTIQSVLPTDTVPTSAPGYSSAVLNQVILQDSSIVINAANYITVSGRKGTIGTEGSFGIVVQCSNNCDAITVGGSGAANNVTLTYLEAYGPPCVTSGGNGEGSCSGDTHGIDHGSAATANLLIDHTWLHRFSEIVRPYQWTGYIIQHSDLDTIRQTPDEHEDYVYAANPSSGTMRYNTWWGSPNDGIFFDFGGNSLAFYGNVMYHSGGAILTFKTGYNGNSVVMYNNTFSSDTTFGDYVCPNNCPWIDFTGAGSSVVENNIFDHVAFSGKATTANWNGYSSDVGKQDSGANSFTYESNFGSSNTQFASINTSNPIVSSYQLTSSGQTTFASGLALAAPYNVDPLGVTRGNSTSWTLGAYQTPGTSPAPPAPPTNLDGVVH